MEAIKIFGMTVLWLFSRLLKIAWWLGKLAAVLIVVAGFAHEIARTSNLMDVWWLLPFAVVILIVLTMHARIQRLSRDVTHIKIAVIAIGNYLKLDIKTDALEVLQRKGMLTLLRQGISAQALRAFFDFEVDDALTARPFRDGQQVDLFSDLRSLR